MLDEMIKNSTEAKLKNLEFEMDYYNNKRFKSLYTIKALNYVTLKFGNDFQYFNYLMDKYKKNEGKNQ